LCISVMHHARGMPSRAAGYMGVVCALSNILAANRRT
jgi:hypothetical protein